MVEKPLIIIAQDNSSSLTLNKDSAFYKTAYLTQLKELKDQLSKDFEVKAFTYGDKVTEGLTVDFAEKRSDFGNLFDELGSRFANRNVGAVIIASDGLYNRGPNPVYNRSNLNASVFTIALGDTTQRRDILVASVDYNKIAYLGNNFRINVNASASGYANAKTQLTVSSGSAVVYTKEIAISSNDFRTSIPVDLEAKHTGTQRFTISLQPLQGEITTKNNTQTIFVDVLDGKQKILLLANSPHPDLGTIKQSIENNKNYEVTIDYPETFNAGSLNNYGLIILHQLPSATGTIAPVLSKATQLGLPIWYIIGNQTYVDLFNKMQQGASIVDFRNSYNEAQAVLQHDFFLFVLTDPAQKQFENYPPLSSPFASIVLKGSAGTLLTQQIGSVKTGQPMLTFTDNAGQKAAYLFGEGLWRWRLSDFQANSNHDAFNELVNKTIQYLSAKEDKRKFRVTQPKKIFDENEAVTFNAELYNDSYEPVNDPEVLLELKNKEGKNFNFSFSRSDKAYYLNAGVLPIGDYTFKAKTKLGDKESVATGAFIVNALNIEELQTTADHQLLYQLAKTSGGEMVYPAEMKKLAELIHKKEEIKTISYEDKQLAELISNKWLFFVILALLTAEWLVRKRNGTY